MRSSTTLMASAIIVGLAAATPMQSHHGHVNCVAPQLWHICSDGWAGCCTTSPRNVDGGGKSYCTDTPTTITTTTPISTQIPAPALPEQPLDDIEWMEQCKEDNSNCNWNITYYSVKPQNETYARKQTQQFYVHKEEGAFEGRTNAIAVFSDIPDTVSKCTIRWYKPQKGLFYGTYAGGSTNITTFNLGGKTNLEATSGEVTYKTTKDLIAKAESHGSLDLGNWGTSTSGVHQYNGHEPFDCSGSEVVVYFALNAQLEAAVIMDQASKQLYSGSFVKRSGWYLKYE